MPALSFRTIEQNFKYDCNQYIEKWCEMETMKFMATDEDNGSKILAPNIFSGFACRNLLKSLYCIKPIHVNI